MSRGCQDEGEETTAERDWNCSTVHSMKAFRSITRASCFYKSWYQAQCPSCSSSNLCMSPGYDLSRRAPRSSRLSVDELSQASKLRAENSSLRLITGLEETLALETMGHQVIETGPLSSEDQSLGLSVLDSCHLSMKSLTYSCLCVKLFVRFLFFGWQRWMTSTETTRMTFGMAGSDGLHVGTGVLQEDRGLPLLQCFGSLQNHASATVPGCLHAPWTVALFF